MVSGQFPPEKLQVGSGWGLDQRQGQFQSWGITRTRQLSPRKIALWLGLGFGLGLVLGLRVIFLGVIVLEPKTIHSLKKNPNKKSAERKWRNLSQQANFKISLVEYQCLPFRSSLLQMLFKTGAFNVTPYSQESTCVEVSF